MTYPRYFNRDADNIVPLHRGALLDDIARSEGIEAQVSDKPDLREVRHLRIRSTFRDRFDATVNELRNDPVFTHFAAAAVGVFVTLLSAIIWSAVLS